MARATARVVGAYSVLSAATQFGARRTSKKKSSRRRAARDLDRPLLASLWFGVDGKTLGQVSPPVDMAPRSWILGVVALQVGSEAGRVVARLRAHRTGDAEAAAWKVASGSVAHVSLAPDPPNPIDRWSIVLPDLDRSAAAISVFLDEKRLATVCLAEELLSASPPPRAFGHVYCRWLRDGSLEPGFDLTDFLSLPEGKKYERRVAEKLPLGSVVSYAFGSR